MGTLTHVIAPPLLQMPLIQQLELWNGTCSQSLCNPGRLKMKDQCLHATVPIIEEPKYFLIWIGVWVAALAILLPALT